MKRFKKLGSLLLAIVMVMSLGATVLAAAPEDGSIVIHKYDSSGTISSDDANKLNDGQMITDNTILNTLGDPLGGVPFKVTQVKDIVGGTDIATSTLTVAAAKTIITNNAAHYTDGTLYQETINTDSTGTATFGPDGARLELGVYLVEELPNSVSTDITAPFLVHIPMTVEVTDNTTDPPTKKQEQNYNVHVYPKNQELYIDKVIEGATGEGKTISKNIGDTVVWNINAGIPTDIASIDLDGTNGVSGKGYFFIDDTLDSRLDYVSTDVYLVDADGNPVDTTAHPEFALAEGTDYTLTEDLTSPYTGGGYIKVDFNKAAGITKLTAALAEGYSIQIDIETEINRSAAYDLDDPISNTAELYYKNDNGDPSDPEDPIVPPTDPQVIVTGLSVVKFDKDTAVYNTDGKLTSADYLQGAVFDLYWSATGADGSYSKVASGTTDANGLIYWAFDVDITNGFASGDVGYGYFYVLETKTPTGYELLGSASDVIRLYADNENGTWELANIKLSGGFELPATGGMGTLLYTIAGLLLIGGALAIFFVSRKRKKASDEK